MHLAIWDKISKTIYSAIPVLTIKIEFLQKSGAVELSGQGGHLPTQHPGFSRDETEEATYLSSTTKKGRKYLPYAGQHIIKHGRKRIKSAAVNRGMVWVDYFSVQTWNIVLPIQFLVAFTAHKKQ